MSDTRLDPEEQRALDDIREYGCHIVHVVGDRPEDIEFSYTVGFPVTVGQPEVIVFSLPRDLRQSMLNELLRQCREGLELSDGLRISNLIEGHDCIVRRIDSAAAIREHFGWAIWYHQTQRGKPVSEAYQLVWPGSRQGLFPWEEGCAWDVGAAQPPLYEVVA